MLLFRPRRFAFFLLLSLFCLPWADASGQAGPKYLIEFGWDRPSPASLRPLITLAESRPFDGLVFRFAGGQRVFLMEKLAPGLLDDDVRELQATRFQRLRHNFVLVQSTSDSAWDWMNPGHWRAAEANIRMFARAASKGGLVGIAFDYEHYGPGLWDGERVPLPSPVTQEQLRRVVRRRGRAFVKAIQEEFPGVTILTFFQLSFLVPGLTPADSQTTRRRVGEYDLMIPFVEGMIDAADSSTSIIDGNELGYYNATPAEFLRARTVTRDEAAALLSPRFRQAYARRIKVALPVFYDYLLGAYLRRGDSRPTRLTESARLAWLTHNVYQSLRLSDKYAWLYSQRINWWGDSVPAEAEAAVRRGWQLVADGRELDMALDTILAP